MKGLTDQKKKKNEKQVVCRRSASADFSLFFFSLILLSGHLSRGHQSWPQNKEKEYGRPRDLWKGIHLPLSFHFLARKWFWKRKSDRRWMHGRDNPSGLRDWKRAVGGSKRRDESIRWDVIEDYCFHLLDPPLTARFIFNLVFQHFLKKKKENNDKMIRNFFRKFILSFLFSSSSRKCWKENDDRKS